MPFLYLLCNFPLGGSETIPCSSNIKYNGKLIANHSSSRNLYPNVTKFYTNEFSMNLRSFLMYEEHGAEE